MTAPTATNPQGVCFGVRQLVSIAVAAEHLGLSDKSVRRYIASGLITGYRVGQRRLIRVDLNEVEARLLAPIPTVKAG